MAKLSYFEAESLHKLNEVKYTANVQHAKSVVRFLCPASDCVGGDFDLSEDVAKAVAARRKLATGEARCKGWHKTPKLERVPCEVLLHYKLNLDYV